MKKILFFFFIILAFQCRERYDAPFSSAQTNFLVVEGGIRYGGQTSISLSRTSTLNELKIIPENDATVLVEGDDNSTFTLAEMDSGKYISNTLPLNLSAKYRVRIITKNNKEYTSAFTPVINTPVIDSLSWKRDNGGLQVYVSSHDPENDTRYYKWDYEETWQFHSAFKTNIRFYERSLVISGVTPLFVSFYGQDEIALRDDSMYTCFNSRNSSSIKIGNTLSLSEDRVYLPLITYQRSAKELSVLYSVNIKQYGISKEAYEFYEIMKKNTESLGSVFDPQPSGLKGNIESLSDPSETVIGFIEACSEHQKRIFINNNELDDWDYNPDCPAIYALDNISHTFNSVTNLWEFPVFEAYLQGLLPTLSEKTDALGNVITYTAAPRECVDCRLTGTNTKPIFWP